ncbi:MAG TPA: NAD(P)H-hydrate epimerase [Planctomycetota bacterium]|nr:NAD(P)H-hydrate epimerase [Planctomycetota bacterium]
MRAVDRRALEVYGIPTLLLMENAGAGLARATIDALLEAGFERSSPVVIVCGKGGNGGDGLVLARHLALAEGNPLVVLTAAPAAYDRASDTGINLTIVEKMKLPIEVALDGKALWPVISRSSPAIVADALLGTGVSEEVREPYRGLIQAMNNDIYPVLAVDVPSGLDCDTGKPLGVCVRAVKTVTFAAEKKGFAAAREYTGEVEVVPIGCPVSS